jgi:CRISPR-associated protein Csm4
VGATYVYRLAPRTAFHFGLRGVGVEETATFCPADTLFSALCLTLREWDPGGSQALESWLKRFPPLNGGKPPPLRLSSAFPYAGEVLFFPKPLLPANLPAETRQAKAKTLKKIALVSQGILQAWLVQGDLNGEVRDEQLLHGGRVWVSRDELGKLQGFSDRGEGAIRMWAAQTLPRVTVDRAVSRSAVYQAGVVRFKPGAGLFALVELLAGEEGVGDAERKRLADLLRVMGHGGLGGERSSGYGQFELEGPEAFGGWGGVGGELFLTLAPYHPTTAEVQAGVLDEGAAYTLRTRRGWVGSLDGLDLRRRLVRLLGEGSVLRHARAGAQSSYGDLSDVTPRDEKDREMLDHKVWRYGIAFPVPAAPPVEREEEA